jgi:tetratricopeptide (TPR) repeat protein
MRFTHLSFLAVCGALVLAAPGALAASAHEQAEEAEIAALDLEAQGNLEAAIVKHHEALQLVPNNKAFKENAARTLNAAAIAKHDAKDDAAAIAYLEEALSLVPTFKQARQNLASLKTGKLNQEGVTLLKNGDFAGSAAKFSEVLALDPDNKPAKINLDVAQSQLLLKDGDAAGAVARLQEAVSLEPGRQFLKDKLAEAQAVADAKAAEDAKEKEKK